MSATESEVDKRLRLMSQRMQQRVKLRREKEGESALWLDAKMVWPNGEVTHIFDISYTGAAIQKGPMYEHKPGQELVVSLDLGTSQLLSLDVEVVWSDAHLVGVSFGKMNPVTRVGLNEFLDNLLLGASATCVAKQFYGPDLACDEWYQGNLDLNIYIWRDENQKITKLLADHDGRGISFDTGVFSYIDGEGSNSAPDPALARKANFKKFVQVLGQLADESGEMSKVVEQLAKECQ